MLIQIAEKVAKGVHSYLLVMLHLYFSHRIASAK